MQNEFYFFANEIDVEYVKKFEIFFSKMIK